MTIESFQDTLFEDPVGLRFRHAREKARLTLEQVARQLRLPVAVLEAIEREDWTRLGAPIFVRSYVESYAKLLGLPTTLADECVRGKPAPQLGIIGNTTPSRGAFDRSVMNLAYLAMTIVIVGSVVMLAMYFEGSRKTSQVQSVVPPALTSETAASETVMASLAPSLETPGTPTSGNAAPSGSAAAGQIALDFRGPSWVELTAPDGTSVERGLVPAGARKSYNLSEVAQVTLGDAAFVDVTINGSGIDLAPFLEAKLARFAVSSEGKPTVIPGH